MSMFFQVLNTLFLFKLSEPSFIIVSCYLPTLLFCWVVLHLLLVGKSNSAPQSHLLFPEHNRPLWRNSQLMVLPGGNFVEEFLSSDGIWLVVDINQTFLKVVMNLLCFLILDLSSECFFVELEIAVKLIFILFYLYSLKFVHQLLYWILLLEFHMII